VCFLWKVSVNGRASKLLILLVAPAALGCGEARPNSHETPAPAHRAVTRFDPLAAATLTGRVRWTGAVPEVAPFTVWANPFAGPVFHDRQIRPNPNCPRIDPASHGVGDAVVFLRGVDPEISRPWDLPPVRVEQRAGEMHVMQGKVDSRFGIVQRGDTIEMVSRDPFLHSLHAGGSAYFTLAFPDPYRPLCRALNEPGVVELSSAVGYYWMRAYLFVDDHPYFARTDSEGRFVLPGIPAGTYQVVCWMPNWHKDHHDRDPESGLISRHYFAKPVQQRRPVTLSAGDICNVEFELSAHDFDAARSR
jgi:hypothetical protein